MLELFIKINIEDKKIRKLVCATIFVWNLVIYSIPLNLLEHRIIEIPDEFLICYAKAVHYFLKIFGLDVDLVNNNIIVLDRIFSITPSCIGYKSSLGVFAIIMATPTRDILDRLRWAIVLAILAFIINFFRVLSTIILFYFFRIDPHFVHNVLWAILSSAIVLLMWLWFVKKNKQKLLFT